MSDYLDLNNEELLKDFFAEAEQQVETLESNILVIENDPSNHEAIDEIFRAAHTLKGGSATVEMMELSGFTHAVEDLLDELRSGTVAVSEPVVDILLSSIDIIKAMLECRQNGSIYEDDVSPTKDKLRSFIPEKGEKKKEKKSIPQNLMPTLGKKPEPIPVASSPSGASDVVPPASLLSEYEILELKELCEGSQKLWGITVMFDESNPMNSVGGIQVFAALKEKGNVLKTIPDFEELYEDEFQPKVVYYIASACSQEELELAAFLDDVSLCTDAQVVTTDGSSSASKASSPVASAPVAEKPVAEKPAVAVETEPEKPTVAVESVAEKPSSAPSASEKSPAPTEQKKPAPNKATPAANAGSVLRVDSKRIDYLLNLISETVIAKAAFNQTSNQIAQMYSTLQGNTVSYRDRVRKLIDSVPEYAEEIKNGGDVREIKSQINEKYKDLFTIFDAFDSEFKALTAKFRSSTQNLGRITGELQEGVMKIRMVPINQIFSRFPRVVRDLCRDLNKKVNLVIEGEDTELDKSVVEDLLDPIMHCVRNSLDHGIETPDVRLENGKGEEGTLLLKASNEGNMIVIDIEDDGQGIDVEKIKNKAIDRGLIHPSKILTDQEAYNLMFEPGFSTADKITNVSGRGVGLDVVKTQIEKLKGTVTVWSERGKGSRFTIRLPLTLAIIQGLLVKVGQEVYSIPIASVIESQRVSRTDISTIDNYEVLNVRDEVISILRLNRLFGIPEKEDDGYTFVVIVGSENKKIGVVVDSLVGEEDVVIKPLQDQFTASPGIAGASILGDGSVSLIIDVSQLLDLGVKQEIMAREERDAAVM